MVFTNLNDSPYVSLSVQHLNLIKPKLFWFTHTRCICHLLCDVFHLVCKFVLYVWYIPVPGTLYTHVFQCASYCVELIQCTLLKVILYLIESIAFDMSNGICFRCILQVYITGVYTLAGVLHLLLRDLS